MKNDVTGLGQADRRELCYGGGVGPVWHFVTRGMGSKLAKKSVT